MQAKRKLTALLLSLCMVLGVLPMTAFAAGCAGCSGRFKAGVDKQRFESQLEPAGTHRRAGDL